MAPSFVDAGLTRFEPTTAQFESFGLEAADPNRGWRVMVGALLMALVGGVAGGVIVNRRRRPAHIVGSRDELAESQRSLEIGAF